MSVHPARAKSDAHTRPRLSASGLYAGYADLDILQGVGLDVFDGEIVTVIGANGAGKSTLMKSLFGLLRPRAGRILLDGTDICGTPPERLVRQGVAFVPQNQNVFGHLSVDENLEMGAFSLSRAARHAVAQRKADVYELFSDLARLRQVRAGNLSGGQQQMVAIGRALMLSPRVLLLDEPTAGLSPKLAMEILAKIVAVNQTGISILMIEQNAKAALGISHHGYVLATGQNQLDGPAETLLASPEIGRLLLGRTGTGKPEDGEPTCCS